MNIDFHYYATYAASRLAGYSAEDAVTIAHAAGYVDFYVESHTGLFPKKIRTPSSQTTQDLFAEDLIGRTGRECNAILRIWPVFHFLPGNFTADGRPLVPYRGPICDRFPEKGAAIRVWSYDAEAEDQFRLVCRTNSLTLQHLIEKLIGTSPSLHMIGSRMHTLADTWSHTYFSGIPAWFMNDCRITSMQTASGKSISGTTPSTVYSPEKMASFCEVQAGTATDGGESDWQDDLYAPLREGVERELANARKELDKVNASADVIADLHAPDEDAADIFGTPSQTFHLLPNTSALYLGHARALHHPDYSYKKFSLKPKWDNQSQERNNAALFILAFRQMLHALTCIRLGLKFQIESYAELSTANEETLRRIFLTEKSDQSRVWQKEIVNLRTAEGAALSPPPTFDENLWFNEAEQSPEREKTNLWAFNEAARTHLKDVVSILAEHNVYLDAIPKKYVFRASVAALDGGGTLGKAFPIPIGLTIVKRGCYRITIPILRNIISEIPRICLRIKWRRYALRTGKSAALEIIDFSACPEGLRAGDIVKLKSARTTTRGQHYLGARRHYSLYYDTKDLNNGRQKWLLEQEGTEKGALIDVTRPVSFRSFFYASQPMNAGAPESEKKQGDEYYLAPHRWRTLIASPQKYLWTLRISAPETGM